MKVSNAKGNKMKKFYTTSIQGVELHIVQCFRPNKGFKLIAHTFTPPFTTWCLVCEDRDTFKVSHLNLKSVLSLLLRNVRSVARVDDVKDSVLCLEAQNG